MTSRGTARRARPAAVLEPSAFGWGREVAAVLRHTTLPWREPLELTPLAELPSLGNRDRLSLVAQFAAHQAFLQFAGVSDGDVDAAQWCVVAKRGTDCRLVRIAATACDAPPPLLTIVQQFAEAVGAPPLDALRRSWGRAESVYHEIHARLRADAAADLRWMHRAAAGEVASPAADGLRHLAAQRTARLRYADDACAESIALAIDDAHILGDDCSPLERFSALAPLRPLLGNARSDSDIVERLIACDRPLIVVKNFARFDSASRRVIDLFAATGSGVLLMPGGNDLPDSRLFVLSPRLGARRATAHMTRERIAELVESNAFDAYLDDGTVPAEENGAVRKLREPQRSFLAALALLGSRIPRAIASTFLRQFLFGGAIEDLATDGIATVIDDALVFASDAVRDEAGDLVPRASRASLMRVAAQVAEEAGDLRRAATLLIESGESKRAVALLERVEWRSDDEVIRELRDVPLSPPLASTLAHALLRAGRYRDARAAAASMADPCPMLAAIERRTGDYSTAIARLREPSLLRAELLNLQGRCDEALADLQSFDGEDAAYLRAVIDETFDAPIADRYLSARLAFYRNGRIDDAIAAIDAARTVVEKIDATLDHLFALFTAGRWTEARGAAIEALALVDETQGDRAAGGILFLLAYLSADDGQFAHASQLIARLRQFYATTHDDLRLRELDLLVAHLDFSRGRFEPAARLAHALLDVPLAPQIVEAAALIVDEIDVDAPQRATGTTGNIEFNRRRAHRGELAAAIRRRFAVERDESPDVKMLRIATVAEFPFAPHDFGAIGWRFVTANRLGRRSEIGSLPGADGPLTGADWIACGDRESLFIEGSREWSAASREAVAALFRLRSENHRLQRVIEQEETTRERMTTSIDGMVGDSAGMKEVFALIARIARRDVAVCILGESGTGKELVARAIHRHSARRPKPFTAVNCAALPETLIESELFGAARGAFTGADRDRAGLIETTDGGTLFLDEIGEMPLAAQAKLLRFLQDGDFRRVGETNARTADVRIVTATNRKLEAAVEIGRFREDLYYRICGIEIALPPLRERASDIPLLASHFLAHERDKHRAGPSQLSPDAEAAIAGYAWPGNVRELQNTIRAAHALAGDARAIALEHLPARVRGEARETPRSSYSDAVTRFRRDLIERSLLQSGGNQNRAAAMLNMSRQALAYQIRELGILVKSPRL